MSELHENDCEWHSWPAVVRGGQQVTRTTAGVLLVHKPTGYAVVSEDARSQMRCRDEAWAKMSALLAMQAVVDAAKAWRDRQSMDNAADLLDALDAIDTLSLKEPNT